jgi:hypothetical protein
MVMEARAIQPMIWYFMTPLRLYPVEVVTPVRTAPTFIRRGIRGGGSMPLEYGLKRFV